MKPSRSYRRHRNSSPILKAKDVAGGSSCTSEQTSELLTSQVFSKRVCLPPGWIRILPPANHTWVSKALFKWSPEMQPEMDYARMDRMWWYPPFPPLTLTKEPEMGCYFGHVLFLWMPRKLWNVKLTCPRSDCVKEELTSAGLHQELRQVVDLKGSYFMASECLVCGKCKRKVISWSHDVVSQLDIGHRVQYPCILASQMGCDLKVVHFNRQRCLGTSISQIQKKLEEHHTEVWLQKTVQYLTDCKGFAHPVMFQSPPAMLPLPKHCWLRQVFALDVLHRMNEIKTSITSKFGRVLKMGSTKKFLRNFSGTWATSVANEQGQVITSVITENKDSGLEALISGVINRYKEAAVAPPEVLYVNRDCCRSNFLRTTFKEWKDMEVRLDISEFMRRIAAGCTSELHQRYATFMDRLSHCIFEWDEEELKQLKEVKRTELKCEIMQPSDDELMHHLSRSELALHCRQTTRNAMDIEERITKLIQLYDGEAGWDLSGVPLFSSNRMAEIWDLEKKHVACIVDPIGVQLYEQTGTLVKGDHLLPTYKCVRGSNSVESFHQHLNQFISGEPTFFFTFFQIYFLDALERWNETTAATSESLQATSSFLQHAVNQLEEEVFQQKVLSNTSTSKYTGELIGLEYLFRQNGNAFQDRNFIIRQMETTDIQMAKAEGYSKQEDIGDWTITQQSTPSLLEDSPSMISRSSQFKVEDLFTPSTSSLANEMTAPEKVVSIKEEESMECNCDDKPIISNLPLDTVMENNNTTQEKASPVQPAPTETQSGSSLTLPLLLSGPSLSKQMMVVLTPFVRRSGTIQCRKCNKERIRSTHRQYYGNWYCQETETKPFAVWKAELLKRGYGRKKF